LLGASNLKYYSRLSALEAVEKNSEEIALAKEAFMRYTRRGWLAFKITSDGKKKLIFTFDPSAEKIQLVPIVEGGYLFLDLLSFASPADFASLCLRKKINLLCITCPFYLALVPHSLVNHIDEGITVYKPFKIF